MKAVVMAGGEGARLRPLTIARPKPMVPVVNKPVMEHVLDLLKRHGITEVIVTLQYLASVVQDHFADGSSYGMDIKYAVEESPLGTAGSVKNAQSELDETFIVLSADAVTDFDLGAIIDYHRERQAMATMTLYHVSNPLEYGVVITDDEGHIRQFLEKPSWGEAFSDTVNTGIYVLEPEVFDFIESGRVVDFSQEVFPRLLREGKSLYGNIASGYWCDVGNLQEYRRANADLLHGKVNLEPLGKHIGGGVWCYNDDVEIAPDAQLYGPVYLGEAVKIKGGVIVRGPSVIRDFTIVDNRSHIDRSIIWRNCYIGERCELRGAIVGRQCSLKSKVMAFEGAVIGDNTTVGDGAIIQPSVKIWPNKEIETGATVSSSIIWGAQGRRVLFGRWGVTGLVNVDITPEFGAKLGAAYGATLPKGTTVVVNRDPHRTPRMIKRAMISGLPSAGVNVLDIKSVPIPVARYITRHNNAAGGVHVRLSPYDSRVVDIKFFDPHGLDIQKNAERKIENTFFREDFRRVYLDEIGSITEAPHLAQGYTEGFLKNIDLAAIQRASHLSLVIDYGNSTASLVLPQVVNQFGWNVVALNATLDETKLSRTMEQFDESMRQLALITMSLRAGLGVRLDTGGEKIFAADDRGQVLPGWTLFAAVASLMLRAQPGGKLAVPVNAPRLIDRLAAHYHSEVIHTRVTPEALMATAASNEGLVLVGDGDGSFIFPQFQSAIDGLFAAAKIVELLAAQGANLVEVIRSLPAYHLSRSKVPCPWEEKGKVMRLLAEQYHDSGVQQIDGVKIELGEEWVLVLPDIDRPLFHIIAESASNDGARILVEKYAALVSSLQR